MTTILNEISILEWIFRISILEYGTGQVRVQVWFSLSFAEAFKQKQLFKERKQTSGNASTKDVCLLTI
jgi:hypothetical protein